MQQLDKTGWQNPLLLWFTQEYSNKKWCDYGKGKKYMLVHNKYKKRINTTME